MAYEFDSDGSQAIKKGWRDCTRVGDLVKALEADLFGASEWAVEQYSELAAVPEPVERVAVHRGLARALDALERDDEASAALAGLAQAESEVPAEVARRTAALLEAREALLDSQDPKEQAATLAPRYLALFETLWSEGPREALVVDALLAAMVNANLLASRGHSAPGPHAPPDYARHRAAGDLYAAVAGLLEARVRAGGIVWQESARGAWNRAMIAWRGAGDESRAKVAEDAARGLGAGAGSYR